MSGEVARLLLAAGAAVLGAGAGYLTHRLNQRLARGEEEAVEPPLPREVLWAPVLDAVMLAVLVFRFGLDPRTAVGVPAILVLVQVVVFDARHRLILNNVIYPAIVLALLLSPVNPLLAVAGEGWLAHTLSAVEGAALGGGLFFVAVLVSGGGVGLGDAKLAFFMGALLGLLPLNSSPIVLAMIYGVVLGGVVAALLLLTRIRGLRDFIPYGPYLCLGAIAAILFPCGLFGPATCA